MMIPNFIDVPFVDVKTGKLSTAWGVIMQQLINTLQTNASDQGLVVPSQDAPTVLQIQNAKTQSALNPLNPSPQFICQVGTLLFDVTNNVLVVALDNAGAPEFHHVVTI